MKFVKLVVLVGSALLYPGWVLADSMNSTDPQITIRGSGGGLAPQAEEGATPVGSTFTLTVNEQGGGVFDLQNASGMDFMHILFQTNEVPAGPFMCSSDLFANCAVKVIVGGGGDGGDGDDGEDPVFILFTGGGGSFPGIPNGALFTVDFGASGWVPGSQFAASAIVVPEPGTLTLLLTGFGVLAARRKMLRNRAATCAS